MSNFWGAVHKDCRFIIPVKFIKKLKTKQYYSLICDK